MLIKEIYYWVQNNIRYIAYEDGYSGYIPASAQEVLSKKYGDCKGMANLLTELLVLSGFDARFTWIGTRDIPYSQTLPALCVNNHAITTLYLNGKEYFLDATEKYIPFGENAYRIQGKEAMIANKEKFEIKMVPLTSGEEHKIQTKADFTLADKNLTGKIKITLTGNERTDFHQAYHDLPVTSQQEFLQDMIEFGNSNITSKVVKTSDLNNIEIPIVIKGESNLSNNVNMIEGDYYVNIDFFPKTLQRYLPDEKRTKGYDLNWVTAFEDELSLTIPANKKFADVTEKLEVSTDGYSFFGEYVITGNKIVLKKKLVINITLDTSQQPTGFQAQSFFTGFGQTLANVSLFIFPMTFLGKTGKIPTWVFASFFLGFICSIASIWWSVRTIPKIPPTKEDLAAIKEKNKGMPHPVLQFVFSKKLTPF